MRYPEWFKRVGDGAIHPYALDVGKKLLGYIAVRKQTPGVETLTQRVELEDGTIVEASFHGTQPRVVVYTSGGAACELYVESGMLDLGPNIAGDATQRFNRGSPEFNDSPAMLHFGDGVDCAPGEAGLNGRVRIKANALSSECLPKKGRAVESRLKDPKKKQAQALLPASCWSGLMQRYMQAIYGGTTVDYKLLGPSGIELSLGTKKAQITPYNAATMGLLRVRGELAFVKIDTEGLVTFYGLSFTPCAHAVFALWKSNQESQSADKLLTVALSCCIPYGVLGKVQLDLEAGKHCRGYGWSFTDAKACAALYDENQSWVTVITFTHSNGHWNAEASAGEKAGLPPPLFAATVKAAIGSIEIRLAREQNDYSPHADRLSVSTQIECPIAAWYEGDEMVTVTYTVYGQGMPEGLDGFYACEGSVRSHNPMIHTGLNAAFNCSAQLYERFIGWDGDYLKGDSGSAQKTSVAIGVYAKREGSVIWSTIRARDAWSVSRPEVDGGTPCLYLTLYADLMMQENPTPVWDTELTIFEVTPQPDFSYGYLQTSNPTAQIWVEYDYLSWDTVNDGTDPRCNEVHYTTHYLAGTGFTAADVIAAVPERCWINPATMLTVSWDNVYTGQGYRALEWWYWHTVGSKAMTIGTSLAICLMDLWGESRGMYVGEIATSGEKFGPMGIVARKHKPSEPVYAANQKNEHTNFRIQTCVEDYGLPISFTNIDEMGDVDKEGKTSWAYSHINGQPFAPCDARIDCFTSAALNPFWAGSPICAKRAAWDGGRASEQGNFLCYAKGTLVQSPGLTGQLRVATLKEGGDADLTGPTLRAGHSCSSMFNSLFSWFAGTQASLVSDHSPLMIETKTGDEPAFETYPMVFGGLHVLKVEPRRALSSLLGATTYNNRPEAFGASIGMDRETITGGYSPVATPSYVGWA